MITSLLKHVSKYINIKDINHDKLSTYFIPKKINKKEFLFSENTNKVSHYFVIKGCLRMFYIDGNGAEKTIQFAIENWWITDYTAFNNNSISVFSLQAVEDVEVLEISNQNQQHLLTSFPIFEKYFRIVFQRAYSASQYNFKFQSEFSREEHYKHFSENFPEFVKRIPQIYLASYLNMTPEYLSKIKNN